MSEKYNYFVLAAVIAAELDKASKVAKGLSITASNARAVALRAGTSASGFRPLTDFIDRLASVTANSSKKINSIAANLSKTAASKFRADYAIARFDNVYLKSNESIYIDTLNFGYKRTKDKQKELLHNYHKQLLKLTMELDTLRDELRTAVILATLSRVEASQASVIYRESLINVAENVESAASEIKIYINKSQQLVKNLQQE
jgi:hypothetical protein